MSFIGSSELWGEDSTARLCQILLEANDGMAQQICENRTDLLDLLTTKDLESVDDCGLSLPYLAIYYDRPEMLRYLSKRGLDLTKPCDPMNFGTPMFYAVSMGKIHCIEMLDAIGVSVSKECDTFMKMTPTYYASIIGDALIGVKIRHLKDKEFDAGMLFKKNFEKQRTRRKFLKMKKAVIMIQKCTRGMLDRIMVKLIRTGAITLESYTVNSGGSVGGKSTGGKSTKSQRSRDRRASKVSRADSVNQEASMGDLDSLDSGSLS